LHGESLTRACLTVGKDGRVEAIETGLDSGMDGLGVDLLLSGVAVETMVESESSDAIRRGAIASKDNGLVFERDIDHLVTFYFTVGIDCDTVGETFTIDLSGERRSDSDSDDDVSF